MVEFVYKQYFIIRSSLINFNKRKIVFCILRKFRFAIYFTTILPQRVQTFTLWLFSSFSFLASNANSVVPIHSRYDCILFLEVLAVLRQVQRTIRSCASYSRRRPTLYFPELSLSQRFTVTRVASFISTNSCTVDAHSTSNKVQNV